MVIAQNYSKRSVVGHNYISILNCSVAEIYTNNDAIITMIIIMQ